jgi:hypothetical protein
VLVNSLVNVHRLAGGGRRTEGLLFAIPRVARFGRWVQRWPTRDDAVSGGFAAFSVRWGRGRPTNIGPCAPAPAVACVECALRARLWVDLRELRGCMMV